MTKKEQIFAVLERIGYKPKYDHDNDIFIIYQMKHIYFLTSEEDEDPFVGILYPQFFEMEDGQELLYLVACNKMTRDSKFAKVFVDQTHRRVSAACEFFYANDESLECCIRGSIRILSVMRTAFIKALQDLDDSE